MPDRRVSVSRRRSVCGESRRAGKRVSPTDWLRPLHVDSRLRAPTQPPPRPCVWPASRSSLPTTCRLTGPGGLFSVFYTNVFSIGKVSPPFLTSEAAVSANWTKFWENKIKNKTPNLSRKNKQFL